MKAFGAGGSTWGPYASRLQGSGPESPLGNSNNAATVDHGVPTALVGQGLANAMATAERGVEV